MDVAALVISIVSLVGSSAFSYLSWRLSKKAYDDKAPNIVCTIGWSARGLRLFQPITAPHRAGQGSIGLKVRNDGERPLDVTDVTCYVASEGQWGRTMHGAWPTGPDMPHPIATGEALWDMPLDQLAHLHGYRRHGEDTTCDVGFRLTLSSGESRDVGPVRVIFPPQS